MSTLNFEELDLHDNTRNAIQNAKISEASPLHQSIISNIGSGKSLVINPKETSEKLSAYGIITLEMLNRQEDAQGTSVLILSDSPENLKEIESQIQNFGLPDNADCLTVPDDEDAEAQADAIKQEPSVIVANPDRFQDLIQEHRFIFRNLQLVILDNMDTMISGGQGENLKRIRRRLLSDYTTLVCAGEFNNEMKKPISGFAEDPAVLGFGDASGSDKAQTPPAISGNINQGYINVPYRMKISTLMAHVTQYPDDRCVIFTASKRGTDRLYRVLKKQNLKATSLHGKLSDEKRAQRFSNFTNGDVQYLLVADISAAELEVKGVNQIINYDVPNDSDEYRYRAGLLGSGNSVQIVSLVSKQDRSDISELQNELGQTPDEIPLPDEVKEKLKKRKENKSSKNGQKKSRGGGSRKQNRGNRGSKNKNDMELPRPTYDKLSGGRTGNHDEEKTGIVKFFKKLFS